MPSTFLLRQSMCLGVALKERDEYTEVHSSRVEELSAELGKRCRLTGQEIVLLRNAARLHDVGKIAIPDRILLKPTSFEPDEWEIMKTHAEIGQKICDAINHKDAGQVGLIVRHHHESFGGAGYPDGLSGEAIPICSRIIAVVDSYDAMTTTRPYHQPRVHHQVMGIIASECDKKIDPYVFAHFEAIMTRSENRAN